MLAPFSCSTNFSDNTLLILVEHWIHLGGFKYVVGLLYTFNYNSDIHLRSYAVTKTGDFVLPTLPSTTQLDQSIQITIRAGINVP